MAKLKVPVRKPLTKARRGRNATAINVRAGLTRDDRTRAQVADLRLRVAALERLARRG